MSERLGFLREAVLAAATNALNDMIMTLALEAEDSIQDESWDWVARGSDGSRRIEKRDIVDTSELLKSAVIDAPSRDANSIHASITWNPVSPQSFYYAELVHNGAADYFLDDPDEPESTRDYAARPWTFHLVPKWARDSSQIQTETGSDVETWPETSWNFAMTRFYDTLKTSLSTNFKVI